MRHVKYREFVKNDVGHWGMAWKEEVATFRGFGVDYEEFDGGPGNFSTAIIELEDGTVKNVRVEDIRFID